MSAPRPPCLRVLLLLALCACGEGGPSDPGPAPRPPLLAVQDRQVTWRRAGADGVPPLTLSWDFAEDAQGWTGPAERPLTAEDGRLLLAGDGRALALSPAGAELLPALQHWLTLRLRAPGAAALEVHWRDADEDFSPRRATTPLPLQGDDWQTVSVPLSSLRGAREAGDVSQGVEQFKLVVRGREPGPLAVELDGVALVSDFDGAEPDGARRHRLEVDGQRRDGVLLRSGGRLETRVDLAAPGRLRLALAAAGSPGPRQVVVQAGLERRELTLRPRDGWHELALERPAGPCELSVALAPDVGGAARASLFVAGPLVLQPAAEPRPPVLLYVEDTLRRDRLSLHGHHRDTDPTLVALAAAGVTFDQAHAASSWTRPSISTLLTSLDPPSHGNRSHHQRVGESVTTLAEAFADAGYLTASFVTNYHGGAWAGLDQGFDLASEPTAHGASALPSTLTSAAITPPLLAFLEEHADEQVFVHVHTLDPHAPYEPETPDVVALSPGSAATGSLPPRLRYDAEVLHNDRQLARLDQALTRLDLGERSLLVFTSDHGEAFGDHGHDEHRQSLHVAELAVPWVLRWPDGLPAGLRVDAPVGHVDLAPTLAGLAAVPAPAEWMGRDLSPLLTGAGTVADEPLLADLLYESPRDGRPGELAVIARQRDGAVLKLLLDLDADQVPTPRALYRIDQDPLEEWDLLPDDAAAAAPLTRWAAEALERGRARARTGDATAMDPATREWMRQLGYLGGDDEG